MPFAPGEAAGPMPQPGATGQPSGSEGPRPAEIEPSVAPPSSHPRPSEILPLRAPLLSRPRPEGQERASCDRVCRALVALEVEANEWHSLVELASFECHYLAEGKVSTSEAAKSVLNGIPATPVGKLLREALLTSKDPWETIEGVREAADVMLGALLKIHPGLRLDEH